MDKKYRQLIEDISVQNEKYTDSQMKDVYSVQKEQLDSLNKLLGKLYIKYGVIGYLKMSATQKANVDVKSILKKMAVDLSTDEVKKVSSIIGTAYKDTYYKSAYTMSKGMKIEPDFKIVKKEFVDAAVNTKFKDELFSKRIWDNKVGFADDLHKSLIDIMNGNQTIDQAAKLIKDKFNMSAYNSSRLVQTEVCRVQSQASHDIGVSMGVTQQMYSATLESNTCSECGGFDGTLYDIDDDSRPEIPEHPNCRCCWVSVPPGGDWSPATRMDNESKQNIDYVTFNQWKSDKEID